MSRQSLSAIYTLQTHICKRRPTESCSHIVIVPQAITQQIPRQALFLVHSPLHRYTDPFCCPSESVCPPVRLETNRPITMDSIPFFPSGGATLPVSPPIPSPPQSGGRACINCARIKCRCVYRGVGSCERYDAPAFPFAALYYLIICRRFFRDYELQHPPPCVTQASWSRGIVTSGWVTLNFSIGPQGLLLN